MMFYVLTHLFPRGWLRHSRRGHRRARDCADVNVEIFTLDDNDEMIDIEFPLAGALF